MALDNIKQVLTKAKRSKDVKQAKKGHDFGKKNSKDDAGFARVAARATKEYSSKKAGEKVAAAAFWKQRAKK